MPFFSRPQHGRLDGAAWARHAMCESAFSDPYCDFVAICNVKTRGSYSVTGKTPQLNTVNLTNTMT